MRAGRDFRGRESQERAPAHRERRMMLPGLAEEKRNSSEYLRSGALQCPVCLFVADDNTLVKYFTVIRIEVERSAASRTSPLRTSRYIFEIDCSWTEEYTTQMM